MKTVEDKAKEYIEGCFDGLSDFIDDEDILVWYKELILNCIVEFHKEQAIKLCKDAYIEGAYSSLPEQCTARNTISIDKFLKLNNLTK